MLNIALIAACSSVSPNNHCLEVKSKGPAAEFLQGLGLTLAG